MVRDHMIGWTGHLLFLEIAEEKKPKKTPQPHRRTLSQQLADKGKDVPPSKVEKSSSKFYTTDALASLIKYISRSAKLEKGFYVMGGGALPVAEYNDLEFRVNWITKNIQNGNFDDLIKEYTSTTTPIEATRDRIAELGLSCVKELLWDDRKFLIKHGTRLVNARLTDYRADTNSSPKAILTLDTGTRVEVDENYIIENIRKLL